MTIRNHDVVILGGGLAGLSLARHLLLETDRTVLLLERREQLPPKRQKVGESTVQLAGYYFSKVLDLEEYLWHGQLMKYNLRFYWKSPGHDGSSFEHYSHGFIRPFSNIASYQLDRNTFEAELLRRNLESPRFTFVAGVTDLEVDLSDDGPHQVAFHSLHGDTSLQADWVVDTTGRGRYLARRLGLRQENNIDHGAFFWWVDGLVNIDKLTDGSATDIRLKKEHSSLGHLPTWLATNHFCAEGLWFWVIPLRHKTSLGLVFDRRVLDPGDVFSVEKATAWVCERFPLFARDLPHREVLDFGGFRSFSYDCAQTIDPSRWAMAGEAGRFTDPLYSPGSDLISIYNTLIVDAIETPADELEAKCALYEQLMRSVYEAYVPSYATSYDVLGDPEIFALKYTWELTVYFGGYVFPFINDLFTERRFIVPFLRLFFRLGPLNRKVQSFLSDYFQWKKEHGVLPSEPIFFDFMSIHPLARAEKTFYRVGVSVEEAREVLEEQVQNLDELARFLVAHVASAVVGDRRVLTNKPFVEAIDPLQMQFDAEAIRARWAACADSSETYGWTFDPHVCDDFRSPASPEAEEVDEEETRKELAG